MRTLIIGTRGSALALWQAEHVAQQLRHHWPELWVEQKIIKTQGDKILDVPLAQVGGKGLFVKEIEDALLQGAVDLAVHSIKDVPVELVAGLTLAAMPPRADPRDALVSRSGTLAELPAGAAVGTSSLRRRCQLLHLRPDLNIQDLRGNVDTRLRKLEAGQYLAIVLAAAGLKRLDRAQHITECWDVDYFLPAVGQGALGLETRLADQEVKQLVAPLHHPPTALCVRAERAMLAQLGGGCQVPVAAHAKIVGQRLMLRGLIGHPRGVPLFRGEESGEMAQPESIGQRLGERLLEQGAHEVLKEVCSLPG